MWNKHRPDVSQIITQEDTIRRCDLWNPQPQGVWNSCQTEGSEISPDFDLFSPWSLRNNTRRRPKGCRLQHKPKTSKIERSTHLGWERLCKPILLAASHHARTSVRWNGSQLVLIPKNSPRDCRISLESRRPQGHIHSLWCMKTSTTQAVVWTRLTYIWLWLAIFFFSLFQISTWRLVFVVGSRSDAGLFGNGVYFFWRIDFLIRILGVEIMLKKDVGLG